MRRGRLILAICLFGSILAIGAAALHHHISQYDDMVSLAAARNGIDFYLVKSLIFEESWFQPDVKGSAGEIGLMQITKAAAADYATRHVLPPFYEARLLEPELNVEIGCWYLKQSLDRYKDSPNPTLFALLRYNAGAARADSWLQTALSKPAPAGLSAERYCLSLVDIPMTRDYASRILRRFRTHNYWF